MPTFGSGTILCYIAAYHSCPALSLALIYSLDVPKRLSLDLLLFLAHLHAYI